MLIQGVASRVYLDPTLRTFIEIHGSKLTYLQSTARLGRLFAFCPGVENWNARGTGSPGGGSGVSGLLNLRITAVS